MAIQISQVCVLNNPSKYTDPFRFQITFDCIPPGVKDELEWKLVYVGSADDDNCDQELDSVLVGPVQIGKNRFIFEAPAPNPGKIPQKDLLDVTVLLLTCSYNKQEFIRVGYYVSNEYPGYDVTNPESQLPQNIDISKIQRNILANKPRVTRFQINWNAPKEGIVPKDDEKNDQFLNNNNNNNGNNSSNANNANNNNYNAFGIDDLNEDDDEDLDNDDENDDLEGFVVNDEENGENNNQNNGNDDDDQDMAIM